MELGEKLKSSISSNILKIIELYNKIDSGQLSPSPSFQRKLVWKKQHKYEFIKTILMNYPFPEVYIASSEMDLDNLRTKEVVVDGQQRLTTIVDYIKGVGDFEKQNKVTPFEELDIDSKREFLNYPVSVKDLKDIGDVRIKEIFQRINSTDYDLNSNEKLNAQYGDSEFAMFAKQLVDLDLDINDSITDVLIDREKRQFVYDFFYDNKVFKENDIKRMFDSQYIMLISATILENDYFGRSTKIDYYLKTYNREFPEYIQVLEKIINALKIINYLGFNEDSYWFNKANLFTLIIELSAVNLTEIDIDSLEAMLLDLEDKFSVYYEDIVSEELISADEQKYFENSRHGSHELQARKHRGDVLRELIKNSIIKKDELQIEVEGEEGVDYAVIVPTKTGLEKNIMDATVNVRKFLKAKGIHDYELQEKGNEHKVIIDGFFKKETSFSKETKISMYRSNGRGDYRIWFTDLNSFVSVGDRLSLTYVSNRLIVQNLSEIK